MKIHYMEQRSPEWYAIKCGKISASSMSAVLAKGQGKARKAYMLKLLAERLSGIPQNTYCNSSMEWGIEIEPQARQAYEEATLTVTETVGFVEANEFLGCSPDSLINSNGGLEIKCPDSSTHIQYILANKAVTEYNCQVQSNLWITEREWWDFVSFDPRIISRPFWKIRVYRDEQYINTIKEEVKVFIDEMLKLESQIKGGSL